MIPASLVACRWLSYWIVSYVQHRLFRTTHVEVGGNSDDGVGNLLAEVGLSNLLHLAKNHGRDFFGSELLVGTVDLNLDNGLAILGDNLVREVLHVSLYILVRELAADKTPVKVC